jgi:hypothetical protein
VHQLLGKEDVRPIVREKFKVRARLADARARIRARAPAAAADRRAPFPRAPQVHRLVEESSRRFPPPTSTPAM